MTLANKQIIFHKPTQMSTALNDGLRALAERYAGNMQAATEHCVERVHGLTEARLTRMRAKEPPQSTRDGQSFLTLVWVLLVDGLLVYRPVPAIRGWLTQILEATDLFEGYLTQAELPAVITLFAESLYLHETYPAPTTQSISQIITQLWTTQSLVGEVRQLPILNRLFIGRDADVQKLHDRLGVGNKHHRQALTIVRGCPGVGKTALINTIAHSETVHQAFTHGVLWGSLGPQGDVFSLLRGWAKQLGAIHLTRIEQLTDLLDGLRLILGGRDILIIADDVWTDAQGLYIKQIVDLQANTVLLTTRFTDVANRLKDLRNDIYILEPLSEAYALELLQILAPEPYQHYFARMVQLIKMLEGLPLALRVAGPTLQHYHEMRLDVVALLDEFEQSYNRLLESTAPSDRFDEATGQTPTIALLFQRSVETLTPQAQLAFAMLGVFKEKPATFDGKALQAVWEIDNHTHMIQTLMGRGLMEAATDKRYRIHQTLHLYAQKLLDTYDASPS